MKTLLEIGNEIGFTTKSKNYRKAFYDKYIKKLDYKIICEYYDLIYHFNLKDKLEWYSISMHQVLSEEFMREFSDKLDWYDISQYQKLSESFMRKFIDKINWYYISKHQKLSEEFMREFSNELAWSYITEYQKLSEDFMREFKDEVDWYNISNYQKLSEGFMREFSHKLDWYHISIYQKLSESFMREFGDKVVWSYIIKYQKLSEDFMRELSDKLDMDLVDKYQYKNDKLFEHSLDDLSLYDIIDGYVYGYKAVRTNRYSLYNFQYLYEDGSIHESFSDQTSTENSFGLSIGTKEFANEYGYGKQYVLLYVRTKISDITRIVHDGQKLRSRRIEIIKEVEK